MRVLFIIRLCIAYALFSLWPFYAFASNVSIEYHIGFNGQFQLGKWAPITILVENRGRALNGKLEIDVTSGSEYRGDVYTSKHTLDVEMPTNSRKKYSFTIQLNSFSHPLIIRLKTGERVIYNESVNLRPHYIKKSLALVTNMKMSPDYLSTLPKKLHPVIVRAQFFPESWYGYDGVELLIMHADAFLILGDKQFNALEKWILRGGYLIIAGGVNYGAFLQERVKDFLSIKIMGFKRVSGLKSLEKFCGQKGPSPNSLLIVKSIIENSVILLKENDISIITQKEMGLGKVLFLAFDYQAAPFGSWDGRSAFWERVFTLRPKHEKKEFGLNEKWILNLLVSEIPSRFPGFIISFTLLAIYFTLINAFIKRIKPTGNSKWRYLTGLLLTIIVFTVLSYWFFVKRSPQKELTYNTFLQLNKKGESKIMPSRQMIGIYALRNSECRLSFDVKHRPITPIFKNTSVNSEAAVKDMNLADNKYKHHVWFPVRKWSHRFFKIDSMIEFPVEGMVRTDGPNLDITLKNHTSYNIIDCNIYYNGHFFYIGKIESNRLWKKRISPSQLEANEGKKIEEKKLSTENITTLTSNHFTSKLRKSIKEAIIPKIQSKYHLKRDTLCFFGWVETHVLPLHFSERDITGENVVLFEWEIPVKAYSGNTRENSERIS